MAMGLASVQDAEKRLSKKGKGFPNCAESVVLEKLSYAGVGHGNLVDCSVFLPTLLPEKLQAAGYWRWRLLTVDDTIRYE